MSAASSLTNAFKDIAQLYEAAHPDTKVQLNFGASGALLQQMAKGAPVDVFASADQETMDRAQKEGLVNAVDRKDLRVTNWCLCARRRKDRSRQAWTT